MAKRKTVFALFEQMRDERIYPETVEVINARNLDKAHGPAIIQSYDPELWDEKGIGNTCFGITRGEAIAAAMKISSKRW